MHELQLATELVRILDEQRREQQVSRILSVTVRLGEFTCLEPDALRVAFTACAEGTELADTALHFETETLMGWCDACERSFPCMETEFCCPNCGGPPARYVSGEELHLVSMEVSD